MKQKLTGLEGEIRQSHIMVRYFNIPFSTNYTNPGLVGGEGELRKTQTI